MVIGASPNPSRYSYLATETLLEKGFPVIPIGIRKGKIKGREILTEKPEIEDVHTVTLYVGPKNQMHWTEYIISLNARRIIFNPGTENPTLADELRGNKIEVIRACTLVMLSIGSF